MTDRPTAAPPRPVTPVAILASLLQDVQTRLEATGADPSLRADLRRATALAAGLDPYLAACTTPESPALARLAGRTAAQDWDALGDRSRPGALEQEMLSGHVEGQLLKLLIRLSGARRALDVGTFTGYSALAMAEALPPGGQVVTCEVDERVAAIARQAFQHAPHGDRIALRLGPALDSLHALADEGATFDLAFLDADKGGYVEHLQVLLDRGLIGPGGLICADNTLLQGQAYLADDRSAAGEAIARFNRAVAADPRVEQVLLPLRDGVTLIWRTDAP